MGAPLHVWLLSDGVPGHVNQARGLVRRIGAIREIDCKEFAVPMCFQLLRPVLRYAQNRRYGWAYTLARWAYSIWPKAEKNPGLIVSAGGNTSFINAMLAQQLGCVSFFMGSLRGLDADLFSAVLTLQPLQKKSGEALQNNIVMPILPSNNDPEEAKEAADALRQSFADFVLGAVLLGGDGSGYRYKEGDWEQLAQAMNHLSEQQKVIWLVTTSRRTGRRGEDSLRRLLNPQTVAEVVWFGENPHNRNSVFLQAADFVLCGEDSMSMVHEALVADAKLVTLSPRVAQPPVRYADKIAQLFEDGYLQRCSISALGALQVSAVCNRRSHQRDWRGAIERAIEPLLDQIQDSD